jgi:uncharacterized phage protein (TIGR02220 family)
LLFLASYKSHEFNLGYEIICQEEGNLITNERALAGRWGWSRTKLKSFILLLENEKMIENKHDEKKTNLTIVNYRVYQDSKNQEKTKEKPKKDLINKDNKENKKDIAISADKMLFENIINYLNLKANKNFKCGKNHTDFISKRLHDGYTEEDFKKVIDIKCAEWNIETTPPEKDMRIYLQPSTLFGNKFDQYLNQKQKKSKLNLMN